LNRLFEFADCIMLRPIPLLRRLANAHCCAPSISCTAFLHAFNSFGIDHAHPHACMHNICCVQIREEARRQQEELEKILEENKRRVEAAQAAAAAAAAAAGAGPVAPLGGQPRASSDSGGAAVAAAAAGNGAAGVRPTNRGSGGLILVE
jgi:hypothetical protein